MTKHLMLSASAVAIALAAAVPAVANGSGATVDFSVSADQMSLRDNSRNDLFEVSIDDAEIFSSFELECSAGQSKAFLGVEYARSDETCAVAGQGFVKNPNNPSQKLLRVGYSGAFTVSAEDDGYTPVETIAVNYQAMGNVPASSATFDGSMIMMPENPGENVTELFARLKTQLEKEVTGTGTVDIVDEVDSITFNDFQTPSAGFPSDKGCSWDGTMIYAYANDSWVIDLRATCDGQTYALAGNMPWVDIDDDTAEYQLNLAKPAAGAVDDGALFTAGNGNDLFAAVDGVTGIITMDMSDVVEVTIGDTTDEVAVKIDASATFTGTGVPLTLVRSLAQVFAVNARALFGA